MRKRTLFPSWRAGFREATGIRRAGLTGIPRLRSTRAPFHLAHGGVNEGGGEDNVIISPPSSTHFSAISESVLPPT